MTKLVIALALGLSAFAQTAVRDTPLGCPSNAACTTLLDYNGSNYLIYTGIAGTFLVNSNQWLKRSDSTLTSIADSSNTATVTCASACGVWIGQRVTVSGATVDTDLNGTYTVLTTPSSTTFTFTTASVTDATYTESTLIVSTNNPLTTQTFWTVTALKYDASNNLIVTNVIPNIAWSNRTSY